MEQRLFPRISADSLPHRLILIVTELLHHQERIHDVTPDPNRRAELSERLQATRRAILAQIERGTRRRGCGFSGQDYGSHLATQFLPAKFAKTGAAIQQHTASGSSASTWRRSSMWHRWEAGSQITWTSTRRKNASRKWSSNWSGRSTGSSARANSPIATCS